MLRSLAGSLPRRLRPLSAVRPSAPYARLLTQDASYSRDPAELDTVTRLPNGIRVATEALPGHFSALGVYVDAGSRYENDRLRGVSHIVDRIAFKSTTTRSGEEMLSTLEKLGGNIQCASSRESIVYQAGVFNKDVGSMLAIMADTIRNPLITDAEVAAQVDTAAYEIQEIWAKPDLILPEILHMTAYKDNTLGNPLLCPAERLADIDKSLIHEYRNLLYRPERMVVAFAGVEHDTAVKLVEQYFGDMKADDANPEEPRESAGLLSRFRLPRPPPSESVDLTAPAHYTGGITTLPHSDAPTHLPQFTQLHIGFEGFRISDPEIFALATLQTLLGGGGSFSAGGPGKGMFSRLYTNVLNQHGWVESCVAFNHCYTDSGVFGISASCVPEASHALAEVICRELAKLLSTGTFLGLRESEVDRAKNQLRSSLLMNLESRMVELEDLGRQVQVHGRKISASEMSHEISRLTVRDLQRAAERVLEGGVRNIGRGTGKPTIVAQAGEAELQSMGDLEAVVRKHKLGLGY